VIAVNNLSVEISGVPILRDVTFDVPKGAMVALIGRNGAGKTTTLRAIIGQAPAVAGRIAFEGEDITRLPTPERMRRGIGYMPEDRRLIPQLSVRENILLPTMLDRRPPPKRGLERIFEMMPEVAAMQDRKALLLSGGQQKLVALARALVVGSRLLILDEPFEGVAPALVARLTEVLAALKQDRSRTLLIADSSLDHGRALYDAFLLIERGQVERPATAAIAGSR